MWTFWVLGATLQMHGVTRESASMSAIEKSTSPSRAMAKRCKTVFVLPPMAMSSLIAFRKESRRAIERGRTDSSPFS